jgi:hypothetical protein
MRKSRKELFDDLADRDLDDAIDLIKSLESRLHQLSEDHSHCEDLLHELGARASSAESRLHSVRLFIDTPHPHWGQGEVLDGVREILDGVVEKREPECEHYWIVMEMHGVNPPIEHCKCEKCGRWETRFHDGSGRTVEQINADNAAARLKSE